MPLGGVIYCGGCTLGGVYVPCVNSQVGQVTVTEDGSTLVLSLVILL